MPPSIEEEEEIITPRNPDTLHNFGPASTRDSILYTAERPGGDPQEKGAQISKEIVVEWIEFMKQHDIKHVLVLLDDNELDIYESPGLLQLYEDNGMSCHRCVMGEKGASTRAMSIIRDIQARQEKVVAHCTHGMGRSGRVAAGWIATEYGLLPEEATKEALIVAQERGVERMGAPKLLEKWLSDK